VRPVAPGSGGGDLLGKKFTVGGREGSRGLQGGERGGGVGTEEEAGPMSTNPGYKGMAIKVGF